MDVCGQRWQWRGRGSRLLWRGRRGLWFLELSGRGRRRQLLHQPNICIKFHCKRHLCCTPEHCSGCHRGARGCHSGLLHCCYFAHSNPSPFLFQLSFSHSIPICNSICHHAMPLSQHLSANWFILSLSHERAELYRTCLWLHSQCYCLWRRWGQCHGRRAGRRRSFLLPVFLAASRRGSVQQCRGWGHWLHWWLWHSVSQRGRRWRRRGSPLSLQLAQCWSESRGCGRRRRGCSWRRACHSQWG